MPIDHKREGFKLEMYFEYGNNDSFSGLIRQYKN